VTAEFEEAISHSFKRFGCHNFHVFGLDWLVGTIQQSARLRTLVPRLYGLGDISQILDERWYLQTSRLLAVEKDNLRKFVPTRSYRRAVNALNKHSFVLLLGEPAVGKTAIAATLTLASGDAWHVRPMKLERPKDLRERWNPEDPKQLFWIDDAFGTTQYDSGRAHEWNEILPWLKSILRSGSKLILTSRDYIYARAKNDLKQSAFPLLRESQVIINVADITTEEREQILYNHVKMGNQKRIWRRQFKQLFDIVVQHEGFRPEIARRIGTSEFTKALPLTIQDMSNFVAKPEEFLRDTIEGLSTENRAALAAIFVRGGALPSPMQLTQNEEHIISRLGGTIANISESLVAMRDTFVRLAVLDDETWIFQHPTISDAFASIIAENPELVDLYIFGASMSKLLSEVSCGHVQLRGIKVIVPKARFDLVIRRLHEYEASEEVSWHERWSRKRLCDEFLANRCSKNFLERYIAVTPEFWENLLNFGSYLSAISEFPVIVKLQKENLLPEDKRQIVVNRVRELAVHTPDTDFLTLPRIKNFFNESEISQIMNDVKEMLLPKINYVIESWRSNYPREEDAESYFETHIESIDAFLMYFQSDEDANKILTTAKEKLTKIISDFKSSIDEDDEEYDFDASSETLSGASLSGNRRIFDDIDV
jgi:hypothetical protein